MAKIDKTKYSKQEYKALKALHKAIHKVENREKKSSPIKIQYSNNIAFVLGNGVSRKTIDPYDLKLHGKIYGCNAIYRTFAPDYLIAVDVKMVLEINDSGYQRENIVWTNPNRAYEALSGFNFFNPNKGWSSGPTALWLAAEHGYDRIYILGFDYRGLNEGQKFNNIYANTNNYKKSDDGATFFGNWLRQTKAVIQENKNINYVRVITSDNYNPEELNKFSNYSVCLKDDFKKIFSLS